jgi:very-short-patch-repair endonuclease
MRCTDMPRVISYRASLTPRARRLRHDATIPERKLWHEFLRGRPEKFTRQKPLGFYIVDFYCASKRLAIEIDGDSHFDDSAERYDRRRTDALVRLGVQLIRFTNSDVLDNFEAVCRTIAQKLE